MATQFSVNSVGWIRGCINDDDNPSMEELKMNSRWRPETSPCPWPTRHDQTQTSIYFSSDTSHQNVIEKKNESLNI
jgi:hypothetical protein